MAQLDLGVLHIQTPLPLAALTLATRTSADIPSTDCVGLTLTVILAAKANTVTITPVINGKAADGTYYTLWTATSALAANGTYVYQLSPYAVATTGAVTEGQIAIIPSTINVVLTYTGNGSTGSFTTTANLDMHF